MEQKLEFITRSMTWTDTFKSLCEVYGISPPTGRALLERYRLLGEQGLQPRSRRPHHCPHRTAESMEQQVVQMRAMHPAWGAQKIRHVLVRQGHRQVPSASTITRILHRHKLIKASTPIRPAQRFEKDHANETWQMDFKGRIVLANGQLCYPLSILDDHSRFLLLLAGCDKTDSPAICPLLVNTFRTYGMPVCIQVDNGPPWGMIQQGRACLTRFEVWLTRLGVRLYHIRPLHPQSNGKVERFHATLKKEVLEYQLFSDLEACQRGFARWRRDYNLYRPHQALDYAVPGSRYQPSPRAYPEHLPEVDYDEHLPVRKVDPHGKFSFQGNSFRLAKALAGQRVALYETAREGDYSVYYGHLRVGRISLRGRKEPGQ